MRETSGPNRVAAKVAVIYALFGMLWILLSDGVLLALVDNQAERLARMQTWKGCFYVLVTAAVLYILIRQVLAHQSDAEGALQALNMDLEARVAERTAQLEAANRELEAFSYSVSHDLKAPLRGVDGYSQILLADYGDKLDDEARTLLGNVRRGVAQMHVLIGDMLAYSRMERRSIEMHRVDLGMLARAVVQTSPGLIGDRVADITCTVPAIEITADREGLTVVLRNLLDNALKFSATRARPMIEIGARDDGASAVLWVRDNGIGFEMKYHDRIFDIFHRLHRAEDYPGTGIGLAMVKKAVNRMGGRVWAESAPDEGATFYVELLK